jgi:hypothetical protein
MNLEASNELNRGSGLKEVLEAVIFPICQIIRYRLIL